MVIGSTFSVLLVVFLLSAVTWYDKTALADSSTKCRNKSIGTPLWMLSLLHTFLRLYRNKSTEIGFDG